jgi:hypothetical protein
LKPLSLLLSRLRSLSPRSSTWKTETYVSVNL